MDEIVINVEFESESTADTLSNEVQVVSSDISWEDFELMVVHFLIFFSLRNHYSATYSLVLNRSGF